MRYRTRAVPLLRLLAYYIILVAIAVGLVFAHPTIRNAFVSPLALPAVSEGEALLTGAPPAAPAAPVDATFGGVIERALTTLLVVLGGLALVLPVAWVYMFTKRLRYDPSLVQSVIILPIVVAGILMVVKNSLALAFSLAGIVAAVRFRNTLKDPKDAVYIFLAIGIGLSAGVQALDVALVISLAFNLVVLLLWKYNVGAIYSGSSGRPGILAAGDPRLLVGQRTEERQTIRSRIAEHLDGMQTDGVLLVHAADPEPARHAVEVALSQSAKEWKLAEVREGPKGLSTLEFLVRMKKKATVIGLLGELEDRWFAHVAAAEFIPFRKQEKEEE